MTSKRSATSDPLDTLALSHGLIIRQPWLDRILDGQKAWEIRGTNTQIRGPIGLIQSGSGRVVGVVHGRCPTSVLGGVPCQRRAPHHHGLGTAVLAVPPTCYAWVVEDPIRLPEPIAYTHPRGAVRWVRFRPPLAVTPPSKGGFGLYDHP